ncbi:beta-ketoacyl synthase N-terminal-like domain-containing protein [Amycolatopsis anabasis]|uniref:beta-ketoacyl synthase N-terminal-like domain-containing protein n=1 Tax=Amycolatopsis anabasis TaxID=1840409 RepID=UPI00131C00BD|nr:beta-ketoacyl synthase N-terminal-like domain-containing protein [Amycolatopsis anabasis]
MNRVVITGIGLLTALGAGRTDTWKALLDGKTAIGRLREGDRLGAEIRDFVPERYAPRRALRMTTRADQLAIAGAALAVTDAGIDFTRHDPEDLGVFAGGRKEISNPEHLLAGTRAARGPDGRADLRLLGERATSAFYPLFYVEGLQSAVLYHLSARHGLRGANAYFHGGPEAGLTAIGRAYRSLRRGESRVALAGGFDDAVSWWALSASDSVVPPGEGAAFVVLEELTAARERDAKVYAEVTGFGATFGEPAAPRALADAGVAEARYVQRDVRAATGDLGAAAGALNAGVAALMLDEDAVPPAPGDSGGARPLTARHTLALARGPQGQEAALVLTRPSRKEQRA